MKRMMLVLGVMGLAACGAQVDPEDVPRTEEGPEGPLVLDVSGGSTPSIYGLIGERERLGLTGEQVIRLDSIALVLAAANDSLRGSVRRAWDGDRPRPGAERWERTRPALIQIARNNQAAGVLVQNTLTEEQRRIACVIQEEVRARNPEPIRRAPPGSRRIGGRRAAPADTAAVRPRPDGWPWCPAPEPPGRRR